VRSPNPKISGGKMFFRVNHAPMHPSTQCLSWRLLPHLFPTNPFMGRGWRYTPFVLVPAHPKRDMCFTSQMRQKHSSRKSLWVMVNADTLEREKRESMGIKTVPAVLYYGKGGNVLEHYTADGNIATVVTEINQMAEKYGEAVEEGTKAKSLKDVGLVYEEPKPKPAPTGRLIRRESRAGAIAAGSTTITRP
jgi:hypothetical protein